MSVTSPIASIHTPRPLRADARRNHERLVRAARESFDEFGAEACLDEIARRAGVGIGTLYRHFPTRRDLLAAVLRDEMEALIAEAGRLLASPAPADALTTWLRAVVAHATASRGLAAELLCSPSDDQTSSCSMCGAMQLAGARLLSRAQASGEIRQGIDADDLFTLVNGIAWATEHSPGDGPKADRLLTLMLNGLRSG